MFRNLLLCVLVGSAHSFTLPRQDVTEENEESSGNYVEEDDVTISDLLEKANRNLGKRLSDPVVRELDIAVGYGLQNAHPCTARNCMWPKAKDGKVYVPYRISAQYSPREKTIIENSLGSFAQPLSSGTLTCIRFILQTNQTDFLDIKPDKGCYSFIGRTRGAQVLSLQRPGCLHKDVIQHELIHALGFVHEHSRSDRDKHVKIHLENVLPGKEHNFKLVETNNLKTPYDYNSVMHYGRMFFSKNKKPTIVPIPDPSVPIGMAKKMSGNDTLRINLLYKC